MKTLSSLTAYIYTGAAGPAISAISLIPIFFPKITQCISPFSLGCVVGPLQSVTNK